MNPERTQTLLLTGLTMVAFAANSLLCRLALGEGAIDAPAFTAVRLGSGALVLWALTARRQGASRLPFNPTAAALLFLYAAPFSFAYLHLEVGTGALILFAAVQVTMVSAGIRAGEAFPALAWVGLGLSLGGLVYLVSPGLTAPPPGSAALMGVAGIAWGLYSLIGRDAVEPLRATAANFIAALPLALLLGVPFAGAIHLGPRGVGLAIASGALASGLGYAVWFRALRGLGAGAAASVQLSVPVLAACGGILWLGEPATLRLALASVLILGGIALVLQGKSAVRPSARPDAAGAPD